MPTRGVNNFISPMAGLPAERQSEVELLSLLDLTRLSSEHSLRFDYLLNFVILFK